MASRALRSRIAVGSSFAARPGRSIAMVMHGVVAIALGVQGACAQADLMPLRFSLDEERRLSMRVDVERYSEGKGLQAIPDDHSGLSIERMLSGPRGLSAQDAVMLIAVLAQGGPSAASAVRTCQRLGWATDMQGVVEVLRQVDTATDPVMSQLRRILALRVVLECEMNGTIAMGVKSDREQHGAVAVAVTQTVWEHLMGGRAPPSDCCALSLPVGVAPTVWLRPDFERQVRPILAALRKATSERGQARMRGQGVATSPAQLWNGVMEFEAADLIAWRLARTAGPWHVEQAVVGRTERGAWIVRAIGVFAWDRLANALRADGATVTLKPTSLRATGDWYDVAVALDAAQLTELLPDERVAEPAGLATGREPRVWFAGSLLAGILGDKCTHVELSWRRDGAIAAVLQFRKPTDAVECHEAMTALVRSVCDPEIDSTATEARLARLLTATAVDRVDSRLTLRFEPGAEAAILAVLERATRPF